MVHIYPIVSLGQSVSKIPNTAMKTPPAAADSCLYGSVVGMDKLLALDLHDNQVGDGSPIPLRPSATSASRGQRK